MTSVAQQQMPAPPALDFSHHLPITDLSPKSARVSSYITATVALVWPYSSSTSTLALLLAEPDVRLRKSKGQVKVVFRGGCAKEVAKTHIGIGDVVKLSLDGCAWKETGDVVSTPGKKIDWDLEYNRRLVLKVLRDNKETTPVDYAECEPESPVPNGAATVFNKTRDVRPQLNGARTLSTIQVPYLTPSKSVRKSSGGTFIDASLDPFAEDDGYVLGRGRKRTKFARHSGAWSLVDSEEEGQPAETLQKETEKGETVSQSQIGEEKDRLPTSFQSDHTPIDDEQREEAEPSLVPATPVPKFGDGTVVESSSP